MKALLLAAILAADDAPKRIDKDVAVTVTGPAIVYNEQQAIDLANRINAAEARPGWPVVLLVGTAGLVVGAVTAGLVVAYSKR